MKLLRDYPHKVLMGTALEQEIYLLRPSWECGWYWGFGYLRGRDVHYHLDRLDAVDKRLTHINIYNQVTQHFSGDGAIANMREAKTLWRFCEVVKTIYALKEAAAVLGRGGSHIAQNPLMELIQNFDEVDRINEVLIPRLIDEMYVAMGVVEPMDFDAV